MPSGNRLLAALPERDHTLLRPAMREVVLERNQVLYEPGEQVTQTWFPIDCAMSLEEVLTDGLVVETAVVGREGMVGVGAIDTSEVSVARCTVDMPGRAITVPAAEMLRVLTESRPLGRLVLAASRAFAAQAMRSAACNCHHPAEARLARWLLTLLDRSSEPNLVPITHEQLARSMGVTRPTATLAARSLRRRGAVELTRGQVEVRSRALLERAACDCYAVVRAVYERLLPGSYV